MALTETARGVAVDVLERVEEGAYSHVALDRALERSDLAGRDRALATEILYGTLTWRRPIDELLDATVDGGLGRLDPGVLRVLRTGAYQLLRLDRVPARAVVDEAVELTRAVGAGAATGLVNAVLRRVADEQGDPPWIDGAQGGVSGLGRRFSLPNWMANRLVQIFGDERARRLAEAFARRPPFFLHLGGRATSADLRGLDVEVRRVDGVRGAVRAATLSERVRQGARSGKWTVRDLGSQLVGQLVGAGEGDRVLDACAGMGGKTFQLAERVGPEGTVVAIDDVEWKLERLRAQSETLGLSDRIRTHCADLRRVADESDGGFDAVLVDAPCSGLGTLRRHPEVRWRRSEADIPELVDLQRELLEAGADLAHEGGTVVYAVCTFTTEEGPKQVARLLDRQDRWTRSSAPGGELNWGRFETEHPGEVRLAPDRHDTDFFYAARLDRAM